MNIFIASLRRRFQLPFNLWMSLSIRSVRQMTSKVADGNRTEWMIQFDLSCWSVDTRSCRIWRLNGCWEWKINGINLFKAPPIFLFMSKKRLDQWSASGNNNSFVSLSLIDVFRCVIWTMCQLNLEFQRINPSTQVALFSRCSGNCSDLHEINWKIYRGEINASLNNLTHWIPFGPTDRSFFGKSLFFFFFFFFFSLIDCLSFEGLKTSNFTATKDLFSSSVDILRWISK